MGRLRPRAESPALPPTPASNQGGGSQLSEIVVTATRRETNLQTTPLAVSAVNQQLIAQTSPHDIGDLSKFVPNFSAAKQAGFNAASFAIRGTGQNNIIVYFEPPVAVLVDDFVVPSVQSQLLDTFDVSQVEVLRGPQGTLFGKNTTGGAVSVRTKRPSLDAPDFQAETLFGDFGTAQAKAALDVPLIQDKLAFRLVGGYSYSDGYAHNGNPFGPILNFSGTPTPYDGRSGTSDGEAVGGEKVFNARAKLLFQPTSRITSLLQYEILRDLSPTPAEINTTPNDPANFAFALIGLTGRVGPGVDPLNEAGVSNRNNTYIDENSGSRVFVDGGYWNTDIRLDPGTVTLVSGYRNQRSRLSNTYPGVAPTGSDGSVLSLFDANRSDNRETFQQEGRFASHLDGPFNFVAGAFYQYDQVNFCVGQLLGFLDLLSGPSPYGPYNNTPYVLCNNQHENSYAGYVEGNYKVTNKFTITAGVRYTYENKIWRGRQQVFAQQLGASSYQEIGNLLNFGDFKKYPQGVVTDSESTGAPTYRASGGYQFTHDLYGYFTYSHGFKSGGFNDQIGSFAAFGNDLDAFRKAASATGPEYANSYEGGFKSEFLDHRVRLNLTGFYVRYADLQKQIVVPLEVDGVQDEVTRFFNAAKAEVKGIEGEFTAIPIRDLTLRAVFGYQDGKYDAYTTPIPAGYDLASSPLDRTPKFQYTLSGNYVLTVLDKAHVTLNADMDYVDKNLFSQSITAASQNTFLNQHTLVNASIQLSDIDDRKYIRLVCQNLGDSRYLVSSQIVGGLWSDAQYGVPRFFGAQMGIKFGG